MKKSIIFYLVIFALVFASGCEHHDLSPVPLDGDYLPTNQDARYYLREQFANPDLSYRFRYDTIRIGFVGDTVIANKIYHQFDHFSLWDSGNGIMEVHDYYRFFRKEGSRYLEPSLHAGGKESVFLDTEKSVGSSWVYYGGSENEYKTTYTIKAVNALKKINGVLHEHVIEVERETRTRNNQHEGYDFLLHKTHRYFVKDKGEIYSLSEWYGYTGALRLSEVQKN